MFRITLALFCALLITNANAQTLQVSTSNYDVVLPTATVSANGVDISDNATSILSADYNYPSEPDPSLKIYPLSNGASIVRENIANFLFYDTFGRVQRSVSNSTQSEGGEAISELAVDPAGKTVVLYNPKVVSGGNTGSRAKLVIGNRTPTDVFYSADRSLRTVTVSDNGELIAFASSKNGTDDEVTILDRFGNNLGAITFDQDVKGVTFSENGLFITIYSGGRAAAFEIRSGERVGSTSFRNTSLLYANYSPEDRTILAVTGSGSDSFSEVEGHAVNVAARKIARTGIDTSLTQVHQPLLIRASSGRYEIKGFSQTLTLRATF